MALHGILNDVDPWKLFYTVKARLRKDNLSIFKVFHLKRKMDANRVCKYIYMRNAIKLDFSQCTCSL